MTRRYTSTPWGPDHYIYAGDSGSEDGDAEGCAELRFRSSSLLPRLLDLVVRDVQMRGGHFQDASPVQAIWRGLVMTSLVHSSPSSPGGTLSPTNWWTS